MNSLANIARTLGKLAGGADELRASVWSAGSLLPLSNARPQPKRQQAARSRDIRNIQATADEAAKAPRPLNCPLLGHFRLPSLLSQPWDGGTTLVRYWYDGGATVGRRWYWGGLPPWLPVNSSQSVGFRDNRGAVCASRAFFHWRRLRFAERAGKGQVWASQKRPGRAPGRRSCPREPQYLMLKPFLWSHHHACSGENFFLSFRTSFSGRNQSTSPQSTPQPQAPCLLYQFTETIGIFPSPGLPSPSPCNGEGRERGSQ